MAKSLKSGLDGILGGVKNTSEQVIKQLAENHRATFVIDKNQHEKLKGLAWWQRKQIKGLLNNALNQYFDSLPENEVETAMNEFKQLMLKKEKK